MKRQALEEIKTVAIEEFQGPLEDIKRLIEPFVQAVEFFELFVKNTKEGWTILVNGLVENN